MFKKFGFSRNQCPKCGAYYWRHTEKADVCGDSNCVGTYKFIGKGTGKGAKGQKITYAEAWKGFERSFTKAQVPCTSIKRYPVVARWRNDVDYVAAGIYCFQPYCVTGELDPPANPLICPQFCVRFNDLDNIGLTGRHYSGFIMLGIQVFNHPDKYVFFKEECVEFNYLWLTQELEIDPDDITFIEDVWAGGGNLGPSIEYFVNGLEVGNMVFMQYKTFHDGSREELPIKIIDTGIGLERIPWLINGSATSYVETFPRSLEFLKGRLGMEINNAVWEKLGPYTSQLNIDEVDDIDKTWEIIAQKIDMDVNTVKDAISPVKDMYIILDHTRSVMMIITDGSLPSNVGGGSNVRNILRRVFAILRKRGWMEKLTLDGLLELFEMQKKDLEPLYGEFQPYKSFNEIIKLEYDKWLNTDTLQRDRLERQLKKQPKLSIDDWIVAMTSWGIPADVISQVSKQPIPGNLYYEIATRQERVSKAAEQILYSTTHLPETKNLYYSQGSSMSFSGKVVEIFQNVSQKNLRNIVILDQSMFYPTSGGQQHDIGTITLPGDPEYNVVNVEKVGKCVLHILDRPLDNPDNSHYIGKEVSCTIDRQRREQLRNNHTGTHIVFAACRETLGPHVWQNGAKKTVDQAHLDITHYMSLTKEQELEIENKANQIILSAKKINKFMVDKAEAEKEYGFRLYQGGIVPGNELRVVHIQDTDVEACCGTHCDNTTEVGWIKIIKSARISDGIVRLYYVAGLKTMDRMNNEVRIINDLSRMWTIPPNQIVNTAERFFKDYKKLSSDVSQKQIKIISLEVRNALMSEAQNSYTISDEPDATVYHGFLQNHAAELKAKQKGIVYIGAKFIIGLLGHKKLDLEKVN